MIVDEDELWNEFIRSVIEPIIVVNKMFAEQLKKTILANEEMPQKIRNLYADMNQMIKQYEEDKSCR